MAKAVGNFFENQAEAERLIRSHLKEVTLRKDNGERYKKVVVQREDGTQEDVDIFYRNHCQAHARRVAKSIPHRMEILVLDLQGSRNGQRKRFF